MANLMHNYLTFGGIVIGGDNSPVWIEKVPNQNRPARKVDVYNVPGRSGDVIIMHDAWENIEQSYEIWGKGWMNNGVITEGAVAFGYGLQELYSLRGYQELRDTYDPDHYRRAYFAGPFDVESDLTKRGRATITFNCDPRRFLEEDPNLSWHEVTVSGSLVEQAETMYDAKPLIKVYGSGGGMITISRWVNGVTSDSKTIFIEEITDGMILDCEEEYAYLGSLPLNQYVYGEYPIWPGGRGAVYQKVEFDENITKLEIRPRWWEL